jgi:hypothetical protein
MTIPIEALRAMWHESERKMYPLATTSSVKYEQVIRLARAVADDLVNVTTSDELAEQWEHRSSLVQAASARAGTPLGDLPETDVAGVAFVLRHNEIRVREHQQHLTQLVSAARADGRQWVTLHERGNLDHGLMDPYQALEMHLESGVGIVSSVEPNPSNGRANHVLTVVCLDPLTGVLTDVDPGIIDPRELDDLDSFAANRAELRAFVEQR